jgi:PKHD-type hydroxylase
MRYKHISNTPFERHRVSFPYCIWDDAFTEDELNDIENYCETFDKEKGLTFDPDEELNKLSDIRKSKIAWFTKSKHLKLHNLFNKLNLVIEKINDDYYNYDLNGYDTIQYTTYDANELGHYAYHVDMHSGPHMEEPQLKYGDSRKLSVSLILSDSQSYEGGQFTIKMDENEFEVEQKRGRILLFPSFILHKVHPVTKGFRKSIVAWVEGPKFR